MRAKLTLEPEVLDGAPRPPMWLEPIPIGYRRKRGLLAFAIGAAIAAWLVWMQLTGGADCKATLWAIVALAVGAWRYWAWMHKEPARRYQSVVQQLTPRQRLRKAAPLLVTGFGGAAVVLLLHWLNGSLQERWQTSLWLLPFGVVGLFMFAYLRQQAVLTPEAAQLKAHYDALEQKDLESWPDKLTELLTPKYIRYPIAGALLWFAWVIATDPTEKGWGWLGIAFWACVAAWEVAVWLLCAGLVIGVLALGFNLVAALPVSVAVIIGALIIAGAVKK